MGLKDCAQTKKADFFNLPAFHTPIPAHLISDRYIKQTEETMYTNEPHYLCPRKAPWTDLNGQK